MASWKDSNYYIRIFAKAEKQGSYLFYGLRIGEHYRRISVKSL